MPYKRNRTSKAQELDPEIVKLFRPSIPDWLDELPKWIDEEGLKPSEFRVFCHVLRRGSGKDGYGWCIESVPNQAKVCKLSPNTVRKCLQKLVKLGLIESRPKHLHPTRYRIVPKNRKWEKKAPEPREDDPF
jgi:DNA-binding MarR family transcriptional regulator